MGKHERGYERVARDLYRTPPWVVDALAEYVDLRGLVVWECACGNGDMATALVHNGCKCVFATDIVDHGSPQDDVLDFLSGEMPPPLFEPIDLIVTNPPFGQGGTLATAFIEIGLRHITKPARVTSNHACLALLLLPCDFDSAKTRARHFADCPHFVAKIVLTKRIVWFKRDDGVRESPKENHAWFIWQRPPLRARRSPVILYARANAAAELPYDAADDFNRSIEDCYFNRSIEDCYAAIRPRRRACGKGWEPR